MFTIIFFFTVSNLYSYSKNFDLGLFSYEHGDYSRAITIFTKIINIKTTVKPEKLKSLELLGIIYYIKGEKEKSKNFFNKLMDIKSDYSLDPLFVPPEIVIFFNSIKDKRNELLKPLSSMGKKEKQKDKGIFMRKVLNYFPMGVGYYLNKRKKEGIFFSVSEALLLSLNVGLYYYRNCGIKNCNDKYYKPGVINEAKTLQNVQLVSGYLFLAFWGYNIIDLNIKF